MGRPEHGATAVDAIIDHVEVVVAGELMLVYTVQAPLVGRGAEAVAVRHQAGKLGVLRSASWTRGGSTRAAHGSVNEAIQSACHRRGGAPTVFSPRSRRAALMGSWFSAMCRPRKCWSGKLRWQSEQRFVCVFW
jgi:hypothetical protein